MAIREHTWRVARRGAVLALVWSVALAQPQAVAGCGEHVTVLPGGIAPTVAAPGKVVQDQSDHNQPQRPCTGPYCSRGSKPVPITAAAGINTREAAAAVHSVERLVRPNDGGVRRTLGPGQVPDEPFPDPIDHPPR